MKPNNKAGKEYLKWSGIAMQGIVAIVALLFLGRYLDDKWGFQKPVLTITGILLGVVYFFYSLFRGVMQK
jgi:hypothetical protein